MSTKLPKVATSHSIKVAVQKGVEYVWCSCGLSDGQPFCNDNCKGTGFKPIKYIADSDKIISFCGCKLSKLPPFCDGSHKQLKEVI